MSWWLKLGLGFFRKIQPISPLNRSVHCSFPAKLGLPGKVWRLLSDDLCLGSPQSMARELKVVQDAGHSANEPGIAVELVAGNKKLDIWIKKLTLFAARRIIE